MRKFLHRLFTLIGFLHLLVALTLGIAGAYVLGSVFDGGLAGYSLGFLLGFGLTYGAIEIS